MEASEKTPIIRVITSMNQKYYNRCGRKMIDSFLKHWPVDQKLVVYHDRKLNLRREHLRRRIVLKDIFVEQPGCKEFWKRHHKRSDQQNSKELHLGAVRFCYKSYAITHAGRNSGGVDWLVWLDADTVTFENITKEFLIGLGHPNKYVTYLGRKNNYSETGFVLYNCNYFLHRKFMEDYQKIYDTDQIFQLPQWHDCMVFDVVRQWFEKNTKMVNINLSPDGENYDHVFVNSVLGNYIDHMKGDARKDTGKSNDLDFKGVKPSHKYWDN